jgi:hypothetical protein
MSEIDRPVVLIVDDEPEERYPFAEVLRASLNVKVVHPNAVTDDDIASADLVLVDYLLDQWPEREQLVPALRPRNGVALTGVLRAHAEADRAHNSPAFSLLSGRLNELSPDFPPEHRPHILAQGLNLEWVFPKGDQQRTVPQIETLARAMKELPRTWKHSDVEGTTSRLVKLLGLNDEMPGNRLAYEDVEKSHPPVHELSETSHGLSIVRWLLQRILPYPTFIFSDLYLAARLRIQPSKLGDALAPGGVLRKTLEPVEYSGTLAGFLGPRWWRSGVEAWIWDVTEGQPHRPEIIHRALEKLGVHDLEYVAGDYEIVCIEGTGYQPSPRLYKIDEAVRIQPDHWPPYADQAWSSIEAVKADRGLRALVIHDDVERLS